jgi:hypothetical protein
VERQAGIAAGIAEKHQHAAVRRPVGPSLVKAFGQDALAGTVQAYGAD